MKDLSNSSAFRRTLSFTLFCVALFTLLLSFGAPLTQAFAQKQNHQAKITPALPNATAPTIPVIIELREQPGVMKKIAAERGGRAMSVDGVANYGMQLYRKQNDFRTALAQEGINAEMRVEDVPQPDGSVRHIEYRFHYLMNGFVAYVAKGDIPRIKARREVRKVYELPPMKFNLDKAIDYILGTQASIADRRLAVYGPTLEWSPVGSAGHPETPEATRTDGFEGQGMYVAVIDSGIDYRHPMFGGTGITTPLPRISGAPPSANDNQKVVYYYALSSPGNITDDFGHGTLVSSCIAGYKVDGTTPANPGYGTGTNGMGVGPVPTGVTLHGTAPQARLLAYKVCGPAPQCAGDVELAMEDAASPVTLVGSSSGGITPTMVAKPVADVINLSLGDTAGDPTSSSSVFANNAALAGTLVVSAAGNEGPGPSTLGAPSVATLAISAAAGLDPGSLSNGALLAGGQVVDPRTPGTAGPPPVTGTASESLIAQNPQAIKLFPAAGGGSLPNGSVSAFYVYVDELSGAPDMSVTNRIALVNGTGAFVNIANEVAPLMPAAILIITDVDSATALQVVGNIPTYTINPTDANVLLDMIGSGFNHTNVPNNTISQFPMRVSDSASINLFQPGVASFSSRGPEGNANAHYRAVKPDVIAPGVGIYGAATPTGLPEQATGLSNSTGYTHANGTSFASPITAGGVALVRQRVREGLGLDSTNPSDPLYTTKRFDSVTVARALLTNAATNLRSGFGVPQADGAASPAINEMGGGLVNLAGAIQAKAIMAAPTELQSDEYTPPPATPPTVLIPTASFGEVPVVSVNATLVRQRPVVIRDVTNGAGAGAYSLTYQDNRNTTLPGIAISFTAADGTTPTTSVTVPAGGQATFYVRISVNGNQLATDPTELQWFVTATKGSDTLRMPFYYRAIKPLLPNIAEPNQGAITGVEGSGNPCPTDTNGNYTINFTYTPPTGGPAPVGFRIQEGTHSNSIFFDNADEPLVAGANSKWSGSEQWVTSVNPDSGSPAYFIPDGVNQNESLAMITALNVPAGGATLTFLTHQELETNFDNGYVEVSIDGGTSFTTVASYTGVFSGTRTVDLSAFAGHPVIVRFRETSDLFNSEATTGWYIEDININSDDFHTIADVGATATSYNVTNRLNGTYYYRVAALFQTDLGTAVGPYSLARCVTVQVPTATPTSVVSRQNHNGTPFDIPLPLTGAHGVECRRNDQGTFQIVFTYPGNVSATSAAVSSGMGNVSSFSASGPAITVNLSGVADVQSIVVSLFGVTGAASGNVSVPVDILLGDVTGNRALNASDVSVTKSRVGQPVGAANFRADVNASGSINATDVSVVKTRSGTALP